MDMLGRGTERKIEENGGRRRRGIVALVVLCGLIIVLGGIVAINVFKEAPSDNAELNYDDTENKKIVQMLDGISKDYREGRREEALASYQEKMDKAARVKDYDLYLRIFSSRDMMLLSNGGCEDIIRLYDNLMVDDLPGNVKTNIYGTAAITSGDCGDAEKQAFYENELDRVLKEEGL